MTLRRIAVLLALVVVSDCVYVYSSFWAPLFDPRILNYRVDAPFSPDAGRNARDQYESRYGARGVNLIADLGNGKGPADHGRDKDQDNVKFYYTYPGANQRNRY